MDGSDRDALFDLQHQLIGTRKLLPNLIEKSYHNARIINKQHLMNFKFELTELQLIPDELLQFCHKYERIRHEVLDEYLELIRMMVILEEKKKCKISRIIDAL